MSRRKPSCSLAPLALLATLGGALGACSADIDSARTITFRDDVTIVTDPNEALPGVFIPPFVDCREPLDDEPGKGPDGKVCSNVAISGATEPGRYFPDYADCTVVLTQRPYRPLPPAHTSSPDDPRLADEDFMTELSWAKSQLEATGCACCHDARSLGHASEWDLAYEPIWLDSLSDDGVALFAGLADSSVLGAYPAEDNFGFDRSIVGAPTTDPERMQALALGELKRRGISVADAAALPPFGGPIYTNYNKKPEPCSAGEGVDGQGKLHFPGDARYVYVLEDGSKNPGVPPNLDLPEGTIWRLDVLPNMAPLQSGFAYGTTPEGSFQYTPEASPAPSLEFGKRYHFVVIQYVGITQTNCTFTLNR